MADEKQETVLEVESNSQETPAEEPIQQEDSNSDEATAQADSQDEGTTQSSADARTKEQVQESERYHQSMNSKLKSTVQTLTERLKRLEPAKSVKSDDSSQTDTASDNEEEYVNSTEQLEKIVDRVMNKNFQKISSQATRNEQIRAIDETIFKFTADNKIPDAVYNQVMNEYGGLVNLAIDSGGDIPKATAMFLHTLANEAGLERDSRVVETAKVDAARKGKALEGVQKPVTSGAPPTPAKETEGQKLLRDMSELGGDRALGGFFPSKKPT